MFRIVCDPSSGSIELYLTEIIRSGSQMFVVCLVSVWQRNFEPVVCVCTLRRAGQWSLDLKMRGRKGDIGSFYGVVWKINA